MTSEAQARVRTAGSGSDTVATGPADARTAPMLWAAMPRLATDHAPEGFEETREALLDIAGRSVIPAPFLAARALEVTMGTDWSVRRAAMEALLRRAKSVDKEELAAVSVPPKGNPFGNYSVARLSASARRRKDPRPYATHSWNSANRRRAVPKAISERRRALRFRAPARALDRVLDFALRSLHSPHGAPSGWCSCVATGYLPRMGPVFQLTLRNRSISLCFPSADRELHPTQLHLGRAFRARRPSRWRTRCLCDPWDDPHEGLHYQRKAYYLR